MRAFSKMSEADEPLSLNSLLDTLMNVIGVSLILLAAADLSLIRTTKEIESSTIPQDISIRLAREKAEAKDAIEQAAAVPVPPSEHKLSEDEERRRLMARLQIMQDEPKRLQDLIDKLTASQRSRSDLQLAISDLNSKLDALRAEMAKVSGGGSPTIQGTTIQLPVRRTIEKQLDAVTVVCRNGRVFILDYRQLNAAFSDAMRTVGARLNKSMSTGEQVRTVVSYFDTTEVGTRTFRMSLQPVGDNGRFTGFQAKIVPRENDRPPAGETLLSAQDTTVLRGLDPGKQYISFLVWADSFPLYLNLRGDIEKYYSNDGDRGTRIGLSWVPYANDEEITTFIDMTGSSPKNTDSSKGTTIDNGG
jgi:hypothetical protein